MSLAARIASGALALVALVALSGGFQLAIVEELSKTASDLAAVDVEALALGLQLVGRIDELTDSTEKYLAVEDPRYLEQAQRVRSAVERDLGSINRLDLSGPERAAADRLLRLWREGGSTLHQAGGLETLGRMREELAAFLQISRAQMRHKAELGAARARRARELAWGATVAAIVLAALLSFAFARSVVVPVRRLTRGTSELAHGNFGYRVEARGAPEVRNLAEHFNFMSERLGELDRLKQDFVSNVSHDLKAPLASMQETTRLLLDEVPGALNAKQRRLLDLNLECGERLTTMISNVLDLARLEAGGVRYRLEICDLDRVVRKAMREVASLLEKKRLESSLEVAEGALVVSADETLLRRAFSNLLSNAVKFSPEGGRMGVRVYPLRSAAEIARRIGADRDGRSATPAGGANGGSTVADKYRTAVVCEFWDSGPGIPDAHKERVFERFHRVDEMRRGDQSTGIGLAITRSIVDGHGGRVWVEDEVGGGTRVVLLLESPQAEEARPGDSRSKEVSNG
ncbi:MAG TPA: HAMP domain-containing sensor histidine kinase [Thermoanaerobaculia bacterium]|nr:HAMP domain-containing sensor histidine kinase [Thermoanaerobaculia bacterium]